LKNRKWLGIFAFKSDLQRLKFARNCPKAISKHRNCKNTSKKYLF